MQVPLGSQGVYTDAGSSEIPPTALIKGFNLNYAPGYLEKAPGALLYNSTGTLGSQIVGLADYWPAYNQQRMLALTANGKLWKDYGDRTFNKLTSIASGLGGGVLNNSCQMVIAGNEVSGNPKLVFIFSGGVNQVQVLSGDANTVSAISLPATDWPNANAATLTNLTGNYPKFGINYLGRLWVFAKSIAYASTTTNHQDFQTSNNILVNNVGPGDGGDINGAAIYKGILLVFKEGDVCYSLNTSATAASGYFFQKFGEGFSISNYHAACQVIDDLIVSNTSGVLTSYQATQKYGAVSQGDLFKKSKVSQFFKQYTTYNGAPFTHSIYYPDKGLALFTARSTYTTANDCLIQLDVSDPEMPKYGIWNHYQADCLAMRRDPVTNIQRPIYGGTDGNVYLADYRDRSVNGSAYTAEFKTPYLDGRQLDPKLASNMPAKNKIFDFLGVTFTPDGNHYLNIDVWIDGKFSETINFTQTVDTNYLGQFKLGSSILGVEEEQTVWMPLHGSGKRISFRGYNSNAAENFKASLLTVGFRPAGEGATSLGQY